MKKEQALLEQQLWERWNEEENQIIADELVSYYEYLVEFHVDRIGANLPRNVDRDDLKSLGLMGLFDAINKFELNRGLKFDTYASFRIRGSIIDGLRREDWLPRLQRERTKEIELTSEMLEQRLQRTPTSADIATELDITVEEVETLVRDSLLANVLSIEEKPSNNEDNQTGIKDMIENHQITSPEEYILSTELQNDLALSIKELNKNEQLVISLFYMEELTMTEIGNVLELSTSRISQIHKSALFKLRNILKEIN